MLLWRWTTLLWFADEVITQIQILDLAGVLSKVVGFNQKFDSIVSMTSFSILNFGWLDQKPVRRNSRTQCFQVLLAGCYLLRAVLYQRISDIDLILGGTIISVCWVLKQLTLIYLNIWYHTVAWTIDLRPRLLVLPSYVDIDPWPWRIVPTMLHRFETPRFLVLLFLKLQVLLLLDYGFQIFLLFLQLLVLWQVDVERLGGRLLVLYFEWVLLITNMRQQWRQGEGWGWRV